MQRKAHTVTIETSTVVRILFLITAFVAGVWLVDHLHRELVWIGVAFFLAVALDPAVNAIAKVVRGSRLVATVIVFILFLAVLAFLGATLVPPLVNQSKALVEQVPHVLQRIQNDQGYLGQFVKHYDLVARAKQEQSQVISGITTGTGAAVGVAVGIFNGLTAAFATLVLTFFMLWEGPEWVTRSWRLVPVDEQSQFHRVTTKMYTIVAGYVTGNLIIALAEAVVGSIMLTLVGVPYAIPLGIVSGLSTLIPLVGGIISSIIITIVALFTSVTAAIIMLIYFTIFMSLEGQVLRPLVFGKTIEMSPLLVIIAIVLGTALAGVVGALVAIPTVACLGVVAGELMHRPAAANIKPTSAKISS